MALDPVCGMTVDPARAAARVDHEGVGYYFCSKGCAAKFTAAPKTYLSGAREPMAALAPQVIALGGLKKKAVAPSHAADAPAPASAAPAASTQSGVEWVCPMDPEVLSDRPGACPKCGMALEPRVPDPSGAPNPELVDMTRRFWIGAALGAPVFLLTMGDMAAGGSLVQRLGVSLVNWIELALATPVVLWCGWPFFVRMWQSFVNASPNMFTLIGVGVGSAYVYSAGATMAPEMFPAGFRDERRGRHLLRHHRRDYRAGAAWPGARTAGAASDRRRYSSAARPRPQNGATRSRTGAKWTFRWPTSSAAIGCAFGRAKKFRSTAF